MLNKNSEAINNVIQKYKKDAKLSIFSGTRKVLSSSNYPALIIEPLSSANEWATTRAQRPRYEFSLSLTVMNSNEDYGVEYAATVATTIIEFITNPMNLNLRILNETKWDLNEGLVENYILDSLIDNVTYSADKEGTIRRIEMSWFVITHETYPDSYFWLGQNGYPDIATPHTIDVP